ncbi:transcription factor SKN7-like, partial [Cyanistes caeruleus]|uniref:transcription factor SKN7-like n=1 Tax=Cyanistes caeruleus TaxID=156563 RepID=UPI000CDAE1B0
LRFRFWFGPRPRLRLLPGPAEDTDGAAAVAASAAASPARAPPLSGAAAGPEPPLSRSNEGTPANARPGEVGERSGAVPGPGPSADGSVSSPGKAQQALQQRYRIDSLLGRGGFGRVFTATRLSDELPMSGGHQKGATEPRPALGRAARRHQHTSGDRAAGQGVHRLPRCGAAAGVV